MHALCCCLCTVYHISTHQNLFLTCWNVQLLRKVEKICNYFLKKMAYYPFNFMIPARQCIQIQVVEDTGLDVRNHIAYKWSYKRSTAIKMSHKHTFTACLQHYHLKMAFGSYFPSMHWFDPRSRPFSILLAFSAFFMHPWHPFGILCIICASSVHPSGILAIFGILCASFWHPN